MAYTYSPAPGFLDADGVRKFTEGELQKIAAATVTLEAAQLTVASKTDQQTGTSTKAAVTPSQQQSHDSAAKAWILFTVSGGVITTLKSYNCSVSRTGAGNYAFAFSTPFDSANYVGVVTAENSSGSQGTIATIFNGTRSAGSVSALFLNVSGFTLTDPLGAHAVFYGRQ